MTMDLYETIMWVVFTVGVGFLVLVGVASLIGSHRDGTLHHGGSGGSRDD